MCMICRNDFCLVHLQKSSFFLDSVAIHTRQVPILINPLLSLIIMSISSAKASTAISRPTGVMSAGLSKMTIDDTVKDTKMMEDVPDFDCDDDDSMCEPYSPEKTETNTKVAINTSLLLTKVATRTTLLSKEEAKHLEAATETQEWQAEAKKESIEFNTVDSRVPRHQRK